MTSVDSGGEEAALRGHADRLLATLSQTVRPWLTRCVEARAPGLTATPDVAAQLDGAATDALDRLAQLLAADIDDQATSPLQLLREAAGSATAVLAAAGVEPARRDEFEQSAVPDDIYRLGPASFAEVDERLREPGLVWGAAKAHVHLKRRATPPSRPRVVAITRELMDRSKIEGAMPGVEIVRSVAALDGITNPDRHIDVLVVDLNAVSDPSLLVELSTLATEVVGYGSHVDEELLRNAADAGIDAMPRSVFFRRLEQASSG